MRAKTLLLVVLLLVVPLLAACTSAPSASPSATPIPTTETTPTPTPTPKPTLAATPEPLLDFPPTTGVALAPGRYSSQPPFDVAFSFEIPVAGWGTAHHDGEFFDVMQPVAVGVLPTRWIAWARPQTFHSTEDIDASGLTPADVFAAFENRGDIEMGEAAPYEIGGVEGLVFDMSTDRPNVKPFGGPDGDLQLDPTYEGRTIALTIDGAPLLVMVFGPRGQLEQAWADSQPIIDSITW